MTYSYSCDGTPVSNLRSLNQTRVHYNRNGDEKSDREKGESDRDENLGETKIATPADLPIPNDQKH